MSRSRKKTPVWKDNDGAGRKKSIKQIYNRRIRRNKQIHENLASGGAYKKVNQSWDICDYSFFPDWDDPEDVSRASRK